MNNEDLLQRLEQSNDWISEAIIQLRELIKNEGKFTELAIQQLRSEILVNVQLTISEMLILQMELESGL